jgi:hypothetical protein
VATSDVFVRLCDVDPAGRPVSACDGLATIAGARQASRAVVALWPTAYRRVPSQGPRWAAQPPPLIPTLTLIIRLVTLTLRSEEDK